MDNKHYNPTEVEDKWYSFWQAGGYFSSTPDGREPYTIVIPPPNVTGVLHMGHMLNNTIQDVLIRKARMEGKNACWVPGTDHASIATEAKVVHMLKEQGLSKKDLTREAFLAHAWEWKEKYGGIILEQLKKLGASCDWNRTRFTMEQDLSEAVIKVFVDLHAKGMVYRDTKMVNWDPEGKTTLSDEEVLYKETDAALYHVRYAIPSTGGYIEVATTRPETILGDTAICVNPEDERYKHLHGLMAVVPFVNREIPIVADAYVESDFGTGCLKVTPAHDINDYNIGVKFNLECIDVFNESGQINFPTTRYHGMDRFEARKEIVKDLKAAGFMPEVKQIKNKVGHSERTGAVIEPRISTQWFLNMQQFMQQNPEVLAAVMDDEIKFFPEKFKNTYRHWIENIKDWNISRQLWWGHRIPAWYDEQGRYVVAENEIQAKDLYQKMYGTNAELTQDEDVLDTWFSSWLWPISVFNGFKEDKTEFNYYYPTSDLVTGPDIIFFWVARMVMAGYEFVGKAPFKNVYFTGIVRDKQRRKMSKSLGNSPDPLTLISEFGADGTRVGILLSAPAGNDVLFDEALVAQGRNFSNKLWNAFKLMQSWETVEATSKPLVDANNVAAKWFQSQYEQAVTEAHAYFEQYKLSDALMVLYKLAWDDFCSQYLEMVKPPYGEKIYAEAKEQAIEFFGKLLHLLHPFMPFITEELYHEMHEGKPLQPLIVSAYPQPKMEFAKADMRPLKLISELRNLRASKGIPLKERLEVVVITNEPQVYMDFELIIKKLAHLESIVFGGEIAQNHALFLVDKDEVGVKIEQYLDKDAEKASLQEEIKYLQGFLKSVNAKLSNEKFVQNAKAEIVAKEQQKQADAQAKLSSLEMALKSLG